MAAADWTKVREQIFTEWDKTIIPTLSDYIRVPCQSPHYDADWATNGLLQKAMQVLVDWLAKQPVKGMKYELLEEPGRTPFLFIEIEGTTPTAKTLFMYGHMDKQPPLLPWGEGLDPYTPVIRDGKLYGRAGADDGYAICASVTSIVALQAQGIPHARTVIVIEGCEESGSFDLPHYMNKLKPRIGDVDLIVCLDSGAMNYDQIWLTTSLRGVTGGVLTVKMLEESMHSGIAGGVVPDAFMVARKLLDRIEDPLTGEILVKELFCDVPEATLKNMAALNDLGDAYVKQFSFVPGAHPVPFKDNVELAVRNFWRPCLTVTGADLPAVAKAGNVIRSAVQLKLSIRCPPLVDAVKANEVVQRILEANPPFGAQVSFVPEAAASGWVAPELKPWLDQSLRAASQDAWTKDFGAVGLGGSIPFMGMLGQQYPEAQFIVTGVLGPQSNAHGPNEFLHIDFAKRVNYCVARVVADHYQQLQKQ